MGTKKLEPRKEGGTCDNIEAALHGTCSDTKITFLVLQFHGHAVSIH